MPDVIADYKVADKFASQVEKNFDLLDSNKDGKLTAEEMVLTGDLKTANDYLLNASLRLVQEHIDLCGHKEMRVRKLEEKDGKFEKIEYLTADLTQKGQAVMVTSREDLAAFRKGIQTIAKIDDQSGRPLDEKELIDIVQSKFETLDKDKDKALTVRELFERCDKLRKNSQTPAERLEEAALRYMARRIKDEGEIRDHSYKEKIAEARTIPGAVTYTPIRVGKITSLMPRRQPDQHIPAEYRTLTEKQSFTTPSQLEQWQKKAK